MCEIALCFYIFWFVGRRPENLHFLGGEKG